MFRSNVLVCGGTGCTSSNSEQIIEKLQEEIKAQGLEKGPVGRPRNPGLHQITAHKGSSSHCIRIRSENQAAGCSSGVLVI